MSQIMASGRNQQPEPKVSRTARKSLGSAA